MKKNLVAAAWIPKINPESKGLTFKIKRATYSALVGVVSIVDELALVAVVEHPGIVK